MKTKLRILMMILIGILLVSSLNIVSANPQKATAKEDTEREKLVRIDSPNIYSSFYFSSSSNWTIMAYLDGDNDLEGMAIDALNHMELVGSNSNLNIVVQIDDQNFWGGQTRRYYVTYDADLDNIHSTLADNDTSEKNMGDPQTLIDFVCWAIDNFPAEHYCLVLFDHGCGWTGVCWDEGNGNDCLTMEELKQSMSIICDHLGKKLDILCFNACSMGMIEVFYQLKDYVDIGIASEDAQWDYLPYDLFLEDLRNNPSWTSEQFAREIVNDSFYGYAHAVNDISAFYTNGIEDIAEKVDVFAEILNESLSCYWRTIRRAIGESLCFDYDFDLYDFASEINKRFFVSQEMKNTAQNVMNAIDNTVIESYSIKYGDNKSCHGLSIYLECRPSYYSTEYEALDFAIDTQWDEFLHAYLNKIESSPVEITESMAGSSDQNSQSTPQSNPNNQQSNPGSQQNNQLLQLNQVLKVTTR